MLRTLRLFTFLPTWQLHFASYRLTESLQTAVAQLSRGAFGSVHYAKYEGNEEERCFKKLKSKCSDVKSRFVRKAKMLLCVIYEYYFAQFKFYFVLKLEQECYS